MSNPTRRARLLLSAAVRSSRVNGVPPELVQKTRLDRFRMLTVARTGIAKGDAVRVTPALYTTERDLDRFVDALRSIAAAQR